MTNRPKLVPAISIILPVYNARQYVEKAVVSIFEQTFSNFELIIIDDGSTDGTADILQRLAMQDSRVILIIRENRGLVASLNEALDIAQGEFIARMDADDVALPNRLAKQFDFLTSSKFDICGTSVQCFNGSKHVWRYPETPEEIEVQLLFGSPYAHPSVMCKAKVYKALRYSSEYANAEDYDIWQRMWQSGGKGANLNDVLLQYRVHDAQISKAQKSGQDEVAGSVRQRHWRAIAGLDSEAEIQLLLAMFREETGDFNSIQSLLKRVFQRYGGAAQALFANHAFRVGVRVAATSRRPWLLWRDLLEFSELGRNRKQELTLFILWALGLNSQSPLYLKGRAWYLSRKFR